MCDDEGDPDAHAYQRTREKAAGCCGDDAWRGHFCEFHRGYLDALLDIEDELEAIERGGW